MNVKEIHLSIDSNGNIAREEMRGFTGGECLEASKSFEEALGGRVEDREMLTPTVWNRTAGEETESEGLSERKKVGH